MDAKRDFCEITSLPNILYRYHYNVSVICSYDVEPFILHTLIHHLSFNTRLLHLYHELYHIVIM